MSMLNITKFLGFDSGIEMTDFAHNNGEEGEDEIWYNKLLI